MSDKHIWFDLFDKSVKVIISFFCLQPIPPPLPSKTPPPPPPKTARKQASIDSGIVQWTKMLTVGPHNTLTTRQKQHHPPPQIKKKRLFFLPTRSSLPVVAWQDGYLTAARPFISFFVFFHSSLVVFDDDAVCDGEPVAQMCSHRISTCCATSRCYQDFVLRWISLDQQLFNTDLLSSTEEDIKE